jgi:transposase
MEKREYRVGIELTDEQWSVLEPLLPAPKRSPNGGQIPAPNRELVWKECFGCSEAAQGTKTFPNIFPRAVPVGDDSHRGTNRIYWSTFGINCSACLMNNRC